MGVLRSAERLDRANELGVIVTCSGRNSLAVAVAVPQMSHEMSQMLCMAKAKELRREMGCLVSCHGLEQRGVAAGDAKGRLYE